MKQTGQILKSAREDQGISINEVAMATKISQRMIMSIEEGDVDSLPAKTFLRGFVQSYASYLKLDVDELLDTFHDEMGSTLPKYDTVEEKSNSTKDSKKSPPVLHEKALFKKIIAGGVILLLIFLIIGIKNIVEKYEKEADVPAPPENLTTLEEIKSEEVVAPSKTNDAAESANTQDADKPVNSEEKPENNVEEKVTTEKTISDTNVKNDVIDPPSSLSDTQKDEPKQSGEKISEKKSETAPENVPDPEPQVEPEKPTPVATNIKSNNEIILEALDTVELEFRVGSGDLERVTLRPDQIHTIKAVGPVTIDLSDGGAVNLIHNGRDMGVPGDLGKPKKIKIQ